ncbi:synaptopodin 2-like protein [Stegastes partitus]|uniref:Synaptopodin 2-like protein n=1 Tax=Stegastes partitus TaxID=144197 RepID=A0A9Y4TZH5_9TELE|nr:PREDICTED: synaptopodin 2-like protein [Stegastes partitus]
MCAELSHAEAMSLIDAQSASLSLRVKRSPSGFLSSSYSGRSASPRSSVRVLSPPATEVPKGITSPPDSEAYYGETDSDADTRPSTHRRQRRTPPHARSPARYDNQEEEEASEMSGYESATEAGVALQTVTKRCPSQSGRCLGVWEGLREVKDTHSHSGEMRDLISPSGSDAGGHTAPHTVYAELQRGESVVEKQVKEARTKCRSIASLLTDAPNPNSKGVLMFKKRRQRAKKYTLTCFGKAEGDGGGETEGETGGETEEEGGSSILSGSEVDEEGFSASFDPTWDTGYLDLLDRRSSACPSATPTAPTTPTTNQRPGLDVSAYQTPGLVTSAGQSPGLEVSGLESSAYQGSRLESSVAKQPVSNRPAHMSPPAVALANGGSVAVSRASVVLSPPCQTPLRSQNGQHGNPNPTPNPDLSPVTDSHNSFSPNAGVLNRTARPFTPCPTPSRASVTSVMFRPPQPKPTAITMATKPVAAVSMVTIPPTHHPSGPDARRAVSSTSLYIPPRNNSSNTPPSASSPPSALSPPSSLSSAPFCQPPANPQTFTPQSAAHAFPSTPLPPSVAQALPAQTFSPPAPPPYLSPPTPAYPPPSTYMSPPPISPPHPPDLTQVSFPAQPTHPAPPPSQPSPSPSVYPYNNMEGTPAPSASMAATPPPQAPAADSLVTREQRISVPAARTGILHEARRRSNKKPMFSAVQNKDVSPNPDLLSIIQNMDDHYGRAPGAESGIVPSNEAGHESGPEEDWLRLGAEACNFMQAQRGPRPPPVAPKPQAPQVPQLAGKGGQLFARRQNRMDRYVVERSPSVAAAPYSPAQTREPSPTPSLPATWKYSSNIRAPPPISYNPLLSPSCPPKAQKKPEVAKSGKAASKGKKACMNEMDIMSHQPYQLNSSLFSYGGGAPQDTSAYQQQREKTGGPQKTARVYEVKRFSTPPPTATGPALKVIVPRSATTLGEPMWRSDVTSPPTIANAAPYQHYQPPPQPYQPQWAASPLSPTMPPAPTAPLPQLPTFQSPTFSHPQPPSAPQANRQFKSAPDLSPLGPTGASHQASGSTQPTRVPRPRFSTSNLGLQPCVWRPGSTAH